MFNKRIEGKNLINIFYSEIKKLVGLENLKDNIRGYIECSLSGVLAREFQLLKASSPSRVKNKRDGRTYPRNFLSNRGREWVRLKRQRITRVLFFNGRVTEMIVDHFDSFDNISIINSPNYFP